MYFRPDSGQKRNFECFVVLIPRHLSKLSLFSTTHHPGTLQVTNDERTTAIQAFL
jgi:hypothetical protein